MIRLNGTEAGGGLGGIDTAWRHFKQAMSTLQAGIAGNAPADRVKAAFKDFVPLCTQSLLVRALGVYWIDLAAELDLLGQVQRTLTIEPAGSDDTRWGESESHRRASPVTKRMHGRTGLSSSESLHN